MNLTDVQVDAFGYLMLLFGSSGDLSVHVPNHVHRVSDLSEAGPRHADTVNRLLRNLQAGAHLVGDSTSAFGQVA
ncbi:hypothetical protein D3C85_201160 [compost metagenome]